jgi:hypothetical protein
MLARKALIAAALGRPRNTRTPMIRREKWSMPTATQQQKGQRWGSDQGSQETQKRASVGTVVRSTNQM